MGTLDACDVRATIQRGRGFVPKTASGKHFAHAIEFLLAGGSSVPADLMLALGEPEKEAIKDDVPGRPDWLKARELHGLKAVTRGLSNKEVGRELGLAEVTIKLHLCSIFSGNGRAEPLRCGCPRNEGACGLRAKYSRSWLWSCAVIDFGAKIAMVPDAR